MVNPHLEKNHKWVQFSFLLIRLFYDLESANIFNMNVSIWMYPFPLSRQSIQGFRIFSITRQSWLSETVHFTSFAVSFSEGSFTITRSSTFIQFDRSLWSGLLFNKDSFWNKIIIRLILKVPKIVRKGSRLLNFSVVKQLVKQLRCRFLHFRR